MSAIGGDTGAPAPGPAATGAESAADPTRRGFAARAENALLVGIFLLAIFLPLSDTVGRMLGGIHVPNGSSYLRAAVLWLTFVGAVIASRERGHIGLSFAEMFARGRAKRILRVFSCAVAAAVSALLAYASYQVARADAGMGEPLFLVVPEWVLECIMPAALLTIAGLFVWQAGETITDRGVALAAVAAGFVVAKIPGGEHLAWPLVVVVLAATLAGAPVFVAMTGVALALYFHDGEPISSVSTEVFRLLGSSTLPALPLLTGCGYVLAESNAAQRIVRLLRALLGGFRGGIALAILGLLAIFTTFTGGSGVTILALGGLALGVLREDGQDDGFSLGLVTTAGSLGLLFPPSIPVILYSVVASVPADLLYLAGALPGILMIVVVAAYAWWKAGRAEKKEARGKFELREVLAAARGALWELSIPVVALALFLSGRASMVEAAAAAFAWTLVVECFITRDIHPVRDLPRVLRHAGVLVGAVLLLLAAALGFTGYLVIAQIPDALVDFTTAHVHSQVIFLLVLNAGLLVLGSVFEIYAAIVVLAPIVAPLGAAFGVNPVHLGVVFLANLEVGFLLPPAGLNLFLSSSRFQVPLPKLYRRIIPFLLILTLGMLVVTYTTPLTEGVLAWFGKSAGP